MHGSQCHEKTNKGAVKYAGRSNWVYYSAGQMRAVHYGTVQNSTYFTLPIKLKSLRSCTKSWCRSSFSSYLAVPVKFKVWKRRKTESWWEWSGNMEGEERRKKRDKEEWKGGWRTYGEECRKGWRMEGRIWPRRKVKDRGDNTPTHLCYGFGWWRRFHSSFSHSHGWGMVGVEKVRLPQNALEYQMAWFIAVSLNGILCIDTYRYVISRWLV